MDKINIKRKLKSEHLDVTLENNTIKLLLSENEAKKIDAVKSLGLDDDLKKFTKLNAKKLDKLNFEKEYGDDVFHINEIEKLCLNYDLRFLESEKYKRDFKTFLIDKVVAFSDKHKINLNGSYVNADFMILDVRENFKNRYSGDRRFMNIFKRKYNNEPFLFYSLGNDYYKMVYSDDSFINISRFIKAWKRKNVRNRLAYFMLMFSFFILPLFGLLGLNLIASVVLTLVASFGLTLFFMPWDSGDNVKFNKYHIFFTINGWKNN